MTQGIPEAMRWSLALASKFARVVFWKTALIVALTLVSQASTLLAFFLPLKIVILLGSERIPNYFPDAFVVLGRDILIASLSAATVGFFLLYILSERLITWVTTQATQRLLVESHKMVLFENQEDIAANAYHRFSRALAGVVFLILALATLLLIYRQMAFLLLGFVGIATLVFLSLGQHSASFQERLATQLYPIINLVTGVGFFVAFAYMIVDFLFMTPPGMISALVSLLLTRQFFARLTTTVQDIEYLHSQRMRVDALFFHGKVLLQARVREGMTIWPLLKPESRHEWVAKVLAQFASCGQDQINTTWHPSGTPDVAILRVITEPGNKKYHLKLFGTNRKALALHEATLLSAPPKGLPAPELLATTQVNRSHCLLYSLPNGDKATLPKDLRSISRELRCRLLETEPPQKLVQRYKRSKPLLWQRIDEPMLRRLLVAADRIQQQDQVHRIIDKCPQLKRQLSELPLVIVNPDINLVTIWVEQANERPLVLNWGRWSLEPVGAGWGEQTDELDALGSALVSAALHRPVLAEVSPKSAQLASLALAFETHFLGQRYIEALLLVDKILSCIEGVENKLSEDPAQTA